MHRRIGIAGKMVIKRITSKKYSFKKRRSKGKINYIVKIELLINFCNNRILFCKYALGKQCKLAVKQQKILRKRLHKRWRRFLVLFFRIRGSVCMMINKSLTQQVISSFIIEITENLQRIHSISYRFAKRPIVGTVRYDWPQMHVDLICYVFET